MALKGLKRESGRLGHRNKSAGPWGSGIAEEKYHDGVGRCGHYDVELDANGYCRDEDCRKERLKKALEAGEAIRLPDGNIIWAVDTKIRK